MLDSQNHSEAVGHLELATGKIPAATSVEWQHVLRCENALLL